MLINDWKFNFKEYKALPCTAPCGMYGVLRDTGIIPDPYYGTNEEGLTALSREDCSFHSEFDITENELNKDNIELIFYGLDTICHIYLNNSFLGGVMNMHRTYEYDVKPFLILGKNTLQLYFKSPLKYFEEMENRHPLYITGNSTKGGSHLRKALYMSGWDWAPKLPDMGIFRPVELRAYNTDKFTETQVLQSHNNGKVKLTLIAKTKHNADGNRVFVEVDGKTFELKDNKAELIIDEPKLWWPNGYGEQPLYDVTFTLENSNTLLDTQTKAIGLRTLTVSTAQVSDGSEFCFVVNGIKIFAMGANYVPLDSILSDITDRRLEQIIEDCKFANFNCIRVWGGAYYPEDCFYELCDKAGLIVWQDFMVACMNVWLRLDFEKEITSEAVDNMKRIRHHACLGLLCGNNEMEEAICNWGIDKSLLVKLDYLKLYEQIFPELCAEHAPETFYLSSSPTSGGGFDNPTDHKRGDVHFWNVWNGSKSFEEYRKYKFRFCSEYGFESLPCVKTIDSFCPPEERNLLSYTMESHQRHANGNRKVVFYLANMYALPTSMEGVVYASQLNQAMAIKYGVEHFRRIRGYCMGSIYWQLNDCWPVASWSSIDYYGRYKALHYFAKKFYAPVAMGLFAENGKIAVNIANESLSDFKGTLKIGVMKNDLCVLYEDSLSIAVPKLTSGDVAVYSDELICNNREDYFYTDLYDSDGNFIMRQTELFVPPKHFKWQKPAIKVDAKDTENGVLLTFSADVFVKNLYIDFADRDIILSDNYFDIANNEPVRIIAKTDVPANKLMERITMRSVYDLGREHN